MDFACNIVYAFKLVMWSETCLSVAYGAVDFYGPEDAAEKPPQLATGSHFL